jgi:preprotein translocase subunit SecG
LGNEYDWFFFVGSRFFHKDYRRVFFFLWGWFGFGLSAAFAGGAASGILGSKTGDFLTWVTIVLVSVFLILAVVLAKFYKPGTTAEFDAGQPMQQTQPIQPSEDRGQPVEEAPFDATGAGESGDVHLPGG